MNKVNAQAFIQFPECPATVQDIISGLTGIIPEIFQGKDQYQNDTFLLGGGVVRVSTAVCFVDSESNVLIWGRPANMQENQNNALDCFGAVAFNNISIRNKVASAFLDAPIVDYRLCPGFAVEHTEKGDVLMLVWNVEVSGNLQNGVIPGQSFVINAEDLRNDIRTKTAKLELALLNL